MSAVQRGKSCHVFRSGEGAEKVSLTFLMRYLQADYIIALIGHFNSAKPFKNLLKQKSTLFSKRLTCKKVKPEPVLLQVCSTLKIEKSFSPQPLTTKGLETEKSQKKQRRLLSHNSDTIQASFPCNAHVPPTMTLCERELLPDFIGESEIFTERGRQQIHSWLPSAYQYLTWRRRYTSSQDGSSFRTFYRATQNCGAHLVLIRTAEDYRFGTFIPHNVSPGMRRIPSNEIFVFRTHPQSLAGYFRRSVLNGKPLYAKSDSYLLGSKPSILLPDGFRVGFSNPSATFKSPMLSKHETFNIICIEVWQIKC